jgi:hypothetical protein
MPNHHQVTSNTQNIYVVRKKKRVLTLLLTYLQKHLQLEIILFLKLLGYLQFTVEYW